MFLIIEENENCQGEERVFSESGPHKPVKQIQVDIPGKGVGWCDVMGVEENQSFVPANSVQVEDSGAGTAILVFGGILGNSNAPRR